jgi:hypothetical protein
MGHVAINLFLKTKNQEPSSLHKKPPSLPIIKLLIIWSAVVGLTLVAAFTSKGETPEPQTSSTESVTDIRSEAYECGKAFRVASDAKLSPDDIRGLAGWKADRNGYSDESPARSAFVEGWSKGFYAGHPKNITKRNTKQKEQYEKY